MPSTRSNTPKSKASSVISSRNSSVASKHSSPAKSAKSTPRRASPQATPRSNGSKTSGAAKPSRGSAPPSASGPMMISSQQQKEDVRAAKKMLEDPNAAKMVLTGDNLGLYKSLKDANSKLMLRLTELNSGLDQQLSKQNRAGGGKAASGHNASTPEKRFQYTADDSPPPLTKADRLAARNLEMKREMTNLNRALKEQQAGSGAIFELRNKASALKKDLEEVQSENKSLENVYGNQNIKTTKHDKGEQQLNDIRREHGDQVRETKELAKQFKDLRELEMARTRTLLKVETQLLEKGKFLSQHGFGVKRRKNKTAASKPTEKSVAKEEKKAKKEKKEKKVRRSSSNGSAKSSGSRSPVSSRSSSVSSSSSSRRSSISNHSNNNDVTGSGAGDDVGGDEDDGGAEPTLTKDLVLRCFPYLAEDSESIAAPFNPKVLHAYLSRLAVEEEELQGRIQSTAVQTVRDRHRTRTQGPKLLQEMDDLREELKLLKEKEEAFEMARSLAY